MKFYNNKVANFWEKGKKWSTVVKCPEKFQTFYRNKVVKLWGKCKNVMRIQFKNWKKIKNILIE